MNDLKLYKAYWKVVWFFRRISYYLFRRCKHCRYFELGKCYRFIGEPNTDPEWKVCKYYRERKCQDM